METYGAEVVASPSLTTNYGRSVLGATPDNPGSLGIAISEAVEDAASRDDTKYSLGSVLNHVLLHQTVIGQEAIEQMGMAGESPDIIIGCTGGGSNFAGLTFPFLGRNFREGATHRVIAVEPEAAPSLTRGVYAYDFGDTGKLTPLVKMHTLGSDFIPEPIHAGGLALPRHGAAGQPAQGARLHRGPQRPPARELRGGRRLRPRRGHPAGARAEPRHPGRDRRGATRPRRPARRGSSCSTCAATATSTCPRTSAISTARWRTTSTRPKRSRPRSPPSPASAETAGLMPRLACWKCGRQLYTVSPLESLFAEERRCPRCGANLNPERREAERRGTDAPGQPAGRSGAARRGRAADRRTTRGSGAAAATSGLGRPRAQGQRQ